MSVDRVGTPALSPGYVLSGSTPDGLGTAVLVVHLAPGGGVGAVSGAVRSPLGSFSISSAGPGLLSIGEVDPSIEWVDDAVPVPDSAIPGSPSGDLPPGPQAYAGFSTIDLLVVFTVAAEREAGGRASMLAVIDRLAAETNEAFSNSGVSAAVRLVGARALDGAAYWIEHRDMGDDLSALADASGGLDAVRGWREDLAADLVHLIGHYPDPGPCGMGYVPSTRSSFSAGLGFGITGVACTGGYTFVHEIGHNLGLDHDRATAFGDGSGGGSRGAWRPWAYGYSEAATFDPLFDSWCLSTIMAYTSRCHEAGYTGWGASQILWFSDPYNHVQGQPDRLLGVFGEVETYSASGPADAARALRESRALVAAYRGADADRPTRIWLTGSSVIREGTTAEFRFNHDGTVPGSGPRAWCWELWWLDDGDLQVDFHPSVSSGCLAAGTSSGQRFSITAVEDGVADPGERVVLWATTTSPDLVSPDFVLAIEDAPPRYPPLPPFADDPVVAGVTPVRAIHIRELRDAVDELRRRRNLRPFPWTDAAVPPGAPVRPVHFEELRRGLYTVYRADGLPEPAWTDPQLVPGVTPVRAVHLNELRAAARAVE